MRWSSLLKKILKGNVVMSLRHDNLKLLVDTDGDKGCRYFTENFKGRVNGIPVKIVDTSGVGDVYIGAPLVSMAKDTSIIINDKEELREAMLFAKCLWCNLRN